MEIKRKGAEGISAPFLFMNECVFFASIEVCFSAVIPDGLLFCKAEIMQMEQKP